jgi:hypothetical protein
MHRYVSVFRASRFTGGHRRPHPWRVVPRTLGALCPAPLALCPAPLARCALHPWRCALHACRVAPRPLAALRPAPLPRCASRPTIWMCQGETGCVLWRRTINRLPVSVHGRANAGIVRTTLCITGCTSRARELDFSSGRGAATRAGFLTLVPGHCPSRCPWVSRCCVIRRAQRT